jgi:hypothetical protein
MKQLVQFYYIDRRCRAFGVLGVYRRQFCRFFPNPPQRICLAHAQHATNRASTIALKIYTYRGCFLLLAVFVFRWVWCVFFIAQSATVPFGSAAILPIPLLPFVCSALRASIHSFHMPYFTILRAICPLPENLEWTNSE